MIDKVQNVSALSLTRELGDISSINSSSSLGTTAPSAAVGTGTDLSFAQVLGGMAADAAHNIKAAESMSFAGIQGKANMREVVDAVMEAQQSLQTAVAFRDKIVSAYLEITKMQI